MNRLAKWVMRLYPARWRARYGDEVEALLADSGADAKTIANLFTGGMRMRFLESSFFRMALMLSIAGGVLGLGASYLLMPQYQSSATLLMTPVQGSPAAEPRTGADELLDAIQREQQQVESRSGLSVIINDPRLNLYSKELLHTSLDDVIYEMRSAISVGFRNLPGRGVAFSIPFDYPDNGKAQQTVNALTNAFEAQNQQMQMGAPPSQGEVMEVLDTASLPIVPSSPNRSRFASLGCLIGFLLSCAVALFRRASHSPSAPMLATNE